MPIYQAIIYGIVQGLAEFLPISSSAHLTLLPWLFGWDDPGLAFDVALHWGTLAAVLGVFWKDWIRLISAALGRGDPAHRRVFWSLVVSAVPGAIIGKPGPMLASVDTWTVTVRGRGGHASMPHHAVDPIPVAFEIGLALQTMVTRRIDAFDPVVLTCTKVAAGTASTVIPAAIPAAWFKKSRRVDELVGVESCMA